MCISDTNLDGPAEGDWFREAGGCGHGLELIEDGSVEDHFGQAVNVIYDLTTFTGVLLVAFGSLLDFTIEDLETFQKLPDWVKDKLREAINID